MTAVQRQALAKKELKSSDQNQIEYLLIGAGTASFAAFRAIRGADGDAKVCFLIVFPKYGQGKIDYINVINVFVMSRTPRWQVM